MRTSSIARGSAKALATSAFLAVAAAASTPGQADAASRPGPLVTTAVVSTREATEVVPTAHGRIGQNVRIRWHAVAAGREHEGDALYVFAGAIDEERAGGDAPIMLRLSLADGRIDEWYPSTKIRTREKAAVLDSTLDLDAAIGGESVLVSTPWPWGMPVCGTRGPDGDLYFCTASAGNVRPTLLRYAAKDDIFEECGQLASEPAGVISRDGALCILTADGRLWSYDDFGGLTPGGRIPGPVESVRLLAADSAGTLYTVMGDKWAVPTALTTANGRVRRTDLLPGIQLDRVVFRENGPGLLCDVVVKEGDRFQTETYALLAGRATRLDAPPDRSGYLAKYGYDLQTDFDARPPMVSVRREGKDWKRYPIVFKRAGWDRIKCMSPGPHGKFLYGGGWPVAWIWRFDPAADELRVLGRHYVFYEMQPWQDELWVTGYWGIKLLRWRPEEPWTFDYPRHYSHKTYPGNSSPWGDKGVSNPRLVCKFRYLKKLHVRRPGGMTIAPDGRVYIGGRTPAVEYFDSRYGGAVSWYDAKTETIGDIREPFLHHSVRDVCSAGSQYVAAAASGYISPFEPLPETFSDGKFVLYDTESRNVALDISPLDAALSYAEEGEPGHVVVAGSPGKYAGAGIAGAFFLFDVDQMRVPRVIRTPFRIGWAEYNVLPFKRGPDGKIYFYGRDDDGVAMLRIDSVTGEIEPVLRAKGITDVATYNNPGAPFAFMGDKVYFGVHHLLSMPIEAVVGEEP